MSILDTRLVVVCLEKGSFISSISGGRISGVCDQFVGVLLDFVSSSQNMPRRGSSGRGRFTNLLFSIPSSFYVVKGDGGFIGGGFQKHGILELREAMDDPGVLRPSGP